MRWLLLMMLCSCGGDAGVLFSVSSDLAEEPTTEIFWRVRDSNGATAFEHCGLWSDESVHRGRPFVTLAPARGDSTYGVEVVAAMDVDTDQRVEGVVARGTYEDDQRQVHVDLAASPCEADGSCESTCFETVDVDSDAVSASSANCGAPAIARYCDGILARDAVEGTTLLCDDFEIGALDGMLMRVGDRAPNRITTTRFECRDGAPHAFSGFGALRTRVERGAGGVNAGANMTRAFEEAPSGTLRIRLRAFLPEVIDNWEVVGLRRTTGLIQVNVLRDYVSVFDTRYEMSVPTERWTCLEWAIPLGPGEVEVGMWVDGEEAPAQSMTVMGDDALLMAQAGFNALNNSSLDFGDVTIDELVMRLDGELIGCD